MPRLGNRRIQQLASCVCGDHEGGAFPYHRHVDLTEFFEDLGAEMPGWKDSDESRWSRSCSFVAACNRTKLGPSGMPTGIETLVENLLDIGEFESTSDRGRAVYVIRPIFDGYPVTIEADELSAHLLSTATSRSQQMIDERFEAIFGDTINDSELNVARLHFRKARGFLRGPSLDYENAAKEAVSSVESYLKTLTQEQDFKTALRKATRVGVPQPLGSLIEKLYAWRGDEPGVAHAGTEAPAVAKEDAEFACNQAMVINTYLRAKLARP